MMWILLYWCTSFVFSSESGFINLRSISIPIPPPASTARRNILIHNELNVVVFRDEPQKQEFRNLLQISEEDVTKQQWHYIQENVYLVYFPGSSVNGNGWEMNVRDTVFHTVQYLPEYKSLLNFRNEHNDLRKLEVFFYDDSEVDEFVKKLKSMNGTKEVKPVTPDSVLVIVEANHKSVLEVIKNEKMVVWVDIYNERRLFNKMANLLVQGEFLRGSFDFIPHHYGLTGSDMLIGITDSGIDTTNCYFHDPQVPEIHEGTKMPSHRKIDYYKQFGPHLFDWEGGHGTHVSGIAAGKLFDYFDNDEETASLLSEYNGAAPDARIHFQDIGGSQPDVLQYQEDLASLLKLSYKGGVRVHSFSFGCGFPLDYSCTYDCQCTFNRDVQIDKNLYAANAPVPPSVCKSHYGTEQCCQICNRYCGDARNIDKFLFENDEFLLVIAAGNYGDVSFEYGTVGCPATAKNVLTVGSTYTEYEHMRKTLWWRSYKDRIEKANEMCNADKVLTSVSECNAYSGTGENCVKAYCDPESSQWAQWLAEHKDKFQATELNTIPDFSSRGPTFDGRRKPDIVTPGIWVLSANGRNVSELNKNEPHCAAVWNSPASQEENYALTPKLGTSMSTPLVAGLAVLIREYFVKGYYPSGERNASHAMEKVSGTLVKAVLIHSARKLAGWLENGNGTWIPLADEMYADGWGIAKIGEVLKFGAVHPSSDYFFVVRDRESITENQKYRFVKAKSGEENEMNDEFVVTITWYEKEGATFSNVVVRNDLDLLVFINSRSGDEDEEETAVLQSTSKVDNVEKVRIVNGGLKKDDKITVEVRKKNVIDRKLKYSIVVSGNSIECASGFDVSSACNHCLPGYTGFECQCEPDYCQYGGYCTSEFDCSCQTGYKGSQCQCQCENGDCLESNSTCMCYPGYTGLACDERLPNYPFDDEPLWKRPYFTSTLVFILACSLVGLIASSCIIVLLCYNFAKEINKRKYPSGFKGFDKTAYLDSSSDAESTTSSSSESESSETDGSSWEDLSEKEKLRSLRLKYFDTSLEGSTSSADVTDSSSAEDETTSDESTELEDLTEESESETSVEEDDESDGSSGSEITGSENDESPTESDGESENDEFFYF